MKTSAITHCTRVLLAALALFVHLGSLPAADWPQWRGSDRLNASRETGLLKEWPTNGPPLVWRATGLGLGIHSVSVASGKVFTVGNREGAEFLFALDAKTGEKLWAARLGPSIQENALMRWLTQRTPTVDGDRVYAFSMTGEMSCLRTADGTKAWSRSYTNDFGTRRPNWGFSDHPLIEGDRLICTPFGSGGFLVALNKLTGQLIWKSHPAPFGTTAHAALIASDAGGVHQFIVFHSRGLAGFAAADGRLLWDSIRPNTHIGMIYSPIARGDFVYSANGYNGGMVGLRLVAESGRFDVQHVYNTSLRFETFEDSTAVVGDHIFAIEQNRPICLELATGKAMWETNAVPATGRATLTAADNRLFIRTSKGVMMLVDASAKEFVLRGSFNIPEHEQSVGVTAPVVADGRLWLRDNNQLFCHDISADALASARPEARHIAVGLTDRELAVDLNAPREPRTGVNRAPDAVFVTTPHDIVAKMLELARPKKADVVVDLGSGDGRFVVAAARQYGCKSIGYEIDARLVSQSRELVAQEKLQSLASIEHKDIFTLDLSGADVITVFLYPRLMERLIPQFEKLKPGSRIVSHQFEMPGVKPDRELLVESKETGEKHRILLWTTPLKKP